MNIVGGISINGCIYNAITRKICIHGWFYPSNAYDKIEVYYNNFGIGDCNIHLVSPDVYSNFKGEEARNCRFNYESVLEIYDKDFNFLLVIKNKKEIVSLRVIRATLASYKNLIENRASLFQFKKQDKPFGGGIIEQDDWFEICNRLISENKKFLDDYYPIWAEYFIQKGVFRLDLLFPEIVNEDNIWQYFKVIKSRYKIILLYGNCQIYKIGEMLACGEYVRKKYLVIRTPAVFHITENWRKHIREIFAKADIFIYQKVKDDNRWGVWASSNYVITSLSAECKKICVPVAYFTGYFPGYYKSYAEKELMPYRDKFIDEMIKCNYVDILNKAGLVTEEMIFENAENSLEKLRNRERETDIIISDFIKDTWREEQLFYTVNHLSNTLYREICRRILSVLGITETNYVDDISEQNGNMQLIWPCVEKVLNFTQEYLYFNKINDKNMYSKEEWIRKYLDLYS